MVSRHTASTVGSGIALLLVTLLLAMAPFAAALEIHHELAAADHDGHEHSDTDPASGCGITPVIPADR